MIRTRTAARGYQGPAAPAPDSPTSRFGADFPTLGGVILRPRSARRSAALALALLAAAAATALGTPQQVLEDYNLDGRIDAQLLGSRPARRPRPAGADLPVRRLRRRGAGPAHRGARRQPARRAGDAPVRRAPVRRRAGASPPDPHPRRAAGAGAGGPPVLPSPVPRPDTSASPPAPPAAAPRRQRLVNRVQDLGSEVLAPAVVVPPRLPTFPTPPAPSPQQRLPGGFVPLAALAAALVAAGVLSGLWRSLRPGGGRRAARRRIEALRLGVRPGPAGPVAR